MLINNRKRRIYHLIRIDNRLKLRAATQGTGSHWATISAREGETQTGRELELRP